MEDVAKLFHEVLDTMCSSTVFGRIILLWFAFIAFSGVLRLCMLAADCVESKPQKEDEERVNRIVGVILNDQQKIDYILKTYDDIETASDMIADIYEKQLQEGENNT